MQRVNKYFEEWLFIQENGKCTLTTKSNKHSTSFPFRVKENVFGKYTISYPLFETLKFNKMYYFLYKAGGIAVEAGS